MGRFFNDVADSVNLLVSAQGGSSENVEEKLARLIVEGCPATTTLMDLNYYCFPD